MFFKSSGNRALNINICIPSEYGKQGLMFKQIPKDWAMYTEFTVSQTLIIWADVL